MPTGPTVKVLLVDDSEKNLMALEAILEGLDVAPVRARSGEQALRRVLDEDFAAVLMDVQMPGMDGFEAAELIRGRERSEHTPILFLTAYQSTEAQVARGYALGAVDFLAKPVVPTVLRAKVAVFVELFLKTDQVKRQAAQLVENQRREHLRMLSEEKRRWELERLREEAAREKRASEALAQKAEELTRSIEERIRIEEELIQRAAQQEIVAGLGQAALSGVDLPGLLAEAAAGAARGLGAGFGRVMELTPDGEALESRALHGWGDAPGRHEEPGGPSASLDGFVLAAGGPVACEDLATEARFAASPALRGRAASGLGVAIPGRDRPFGTLAAFAEAPRSFTRDDLNFLQAVSNVLAAAIQRRRDERELASVRDALEVQLDDMTRLHALSEQLSRSLEMSAVLEKVLAAVTGLQGTDRGVLLLYDKERDAMTTAASVGFTPGRPDAGGTPPAETWVGGAVAAVISGGIIARDIADDPVLAPHLDEARAAGYRAVCSTPLLTCGGDLVGAIATYFPHLHRPSDGETRLVELYARQAAEFIDNARLYRAIREADRRKGEFLAMLGHELRNPLAPILNSLQFMRLPDLPRDEVERAREVAERQVRHLARLVDDLLDVSRIDQGKIELRKGRIDLRESASRAVETARPLIEARRHELTVSLPDAPVVVSADAARIEQVLANLLNNAAKYTEPGGRIALEVVREGDEALARVADNGIGIDPELLPRVFELFTQAERSLDRSQGGLGIGLTLVSRLVEMHGGAVEARSAGIGRGSEFTVRLPIGRPAEDGGAAPAPRPGAGGGCPPDEARAVLVVDDNIDGARILARLLEAGGHRVAVAHDGLGALEVARTFAPDVVLLDIGLPEMDGYEVARRLRAMEGLERTALIALTGYGRDDDRTRSIASGFDHHLVKPVDPDVIRGLLARPPSPGPAAR